MHINQLPLELLQQILSSLSYYDQLEIASLVCHHWLRAVETFIVHKGRIRITEKVLDKWDIVQASLRRYKIVLIADVHDWQTLRTTVLKCVQQFPDAVELYLDGFPQNFLPRFYAAYQNWEEKLPLTNDDRKLCYRDEYINTLPDLNGLIWLDCLEFNGANRPAETKDHILQDDSVDCSNDNKRKLDCIEQ